jgi:hypothetical protein
VLCICSGAIRLQYVLCARTSFWQYRECFSIYDVSGAHWFVPARYANWDGCDRHNTANRDIDQNCNDHTDAQQYSHCCPADEHERSKPNKDIDTSRAERDIDKHPCYVDQNTNVSAAKRNSIADGANEHADTVDNEDAVADTVEDVDAQPNFYTVEDANAQPDVHSISDEDAVADADANADADQDQYVIADEHADANADADQDQYVATADEYFAADGHADTVAHADDTAVAHADDTVDKYTGAIADKHVSANTYGDY